MKSHSFFGYFTFVDPDIYRSSTYQFYDCVITKSFGEIPKGYEIHHIDGNRKNNSIDNLQLVTIEEHLEIHKREDNLGAVQAILWRMNNVDKKELSEVARTVQKRLLKEGKHNFQKFDRVQMSKEIIEKRLSEGKPAFLGIDDFVENGRKAGLKAKEKKQVF